MPSTREMHTPVCSPEWIQSQEERLCIENRTEKSKILPKETHSHYFWHRINFAAIVKLFIIASAASLSCSTHSHISKSYTTFQMVDHLLFITELASRFHFILIYSLWPASTTSYFISLLNLEIIIKFLALHVRTTGPNANKANMRAGKRNTYNFFFLILFIAKKKKEQNRRPPHLKHLSEKLFHFQF